jgi:hypothetical protein
MQDAATGSRLDADFFLWIAVDKVDYSDRIAVVHSGCDWLAKLHPNSLRFGT